MHVLVTYKNEVDGIKRKELDCSQDYSHYKSMGIFTDAQGQLTPLSSLSASMKKIRSKMKVLECSQDFPHYNPRGAIGCHGNRVPIRSGQKPNAAFLQPQ